VGLHGALTAQVIADEHGHEVDDLVAAKAASDEADLLFERIEKPVLAQIPGNEHGFSEPGRDGGLRRFRRLHTEAGMRYGCHRDLHREPGNEALPDLRSLASLRCYIAITSLRISWDVAIFGNLDVWCALAFTPARVALQALPERIRSATLFPWWPRRLHK